MSERRLILASTSPRRRLLLTQAGFDHDAIDPGIDDAELHHQGVPARDWAVSLAHLKARAGLERAQEPLLAHSPHRPLVLAGDTVVVKDDRIIGKPDDADDARRIIALLRGGSHTVVSGVAILWDAGRELFADEARVSVGDISDAELDAYIATGAWRGKAGAYNLAERLDAAWPIHCQGDPATVMGLPMQRLAPVLQRLLGREPARR